jgi:hypothetical protein
LIRGRKDGTGGRDLAEGVRIHTTPPAPAAHGHALETGHAANTISGTAGVVRTRPATRIILMTLKMEDRTVKSRTYLVLVGIVATAIGAFSARMARGDKETVKVDKRVFELRTYYANPGKMEALHTRFREVTNKLFEKHGMTIIGFWTDSKEAERKLIYILAYPSKEAADKSWQAFRDDPAWKTAKEASEKNGVLVEKVESVYMNPTDYSPLK